MIKYICNVCGRVAKDSEAETLVIYKGLDCKEYKLCPTCSEAIKKELEKGVSHENNMVRHPEVLERQRDTARVQRQK